MAKSKERKHTARMINFLKLTTLKDVVTYIIGQYYKNIAIVGELKYRVESQVFEVEVMDKCYLYWLRENPQYDYELNKTFFRDKMDFLLRFTEKSEAKNASENRRKELLAQRNYAKV